MNVTIVSDVLGEENNGVTITTMNLIRSLKKKGHNVKILCPDVDKIGHDNYYVTPHRSFGLLDDYVKKVGVVIAKPCDDVINQALEGADIAHVIVPFSVGRRATQMAIKKGIPVTGGFHALAENLTTHVFLQNSAIANRLIYTFFSTFYRHMHAIHYPTQYLRDLYEGYYGETNGYVISNGVQDKFRPIPATKPDVLKDKFVIVFTGRYSKEKSHDILIDAVAKSKHHEKIQLIFAGRGPQLERLQRLGAKLVNPPIFSFFAHDEMVKILNYADLYVHPAEIEAEGIACLEAISCGLVPVISDSPRCATQAYALDEKNLFKFNSPRNLAQKIDWWLDNPEERNLRSKEYIYYAKGNFDYSVCMDRMEEMLLETIERARNSK